MMLILMKIFEIIIMGGFFLSDKSQESYAIILGTVIVIIFIVSLTENLQFADAISVSADKLIYDIEVGDTLLLYWSVRNTDPYSIDIEFYATGPGSELLVFEQFGHLDVKERKSFEILASIPADHEDNVEYRPVLHVLQRSQDPDSEESVDGASVAKVNVVMKTVPIIRIGENPVYTPPVIENLENPESDPALEKAKSPEVIEKAETIEEKLARIQAFNQANTQKDTSLTPTIENQVIQDVDSGYESEPKMDPEPVIDTIVDKNETVNGGGCLIATAAYGTELAPQVQFLREIRDNTVMSTTSGAAFMTGFNMLYYSFSPTIADWERENPVFQEAVRAFITPMISTLSIMTLAEDGSEIEVLGLGISVITLNLGMYIVAPAVVGFTISKRLKK